MSLAMPLRGVPSKVVNPLPIRILPLDCAAIELTP